jgi:type II secretory pathway component PulK
MRRGYALIAVLWILALASAAAAAAALAAREAVAGARNRQILTRSQWLAEGCISVALSVLDSVTAIPAAWRALDTVTVGVGACDVEMRPAGVTVDVNTATHEQLGRLLAAVGIGQPGNELLVSALLDWRDADDEPRALGAETGWYSARRRFAPRNAHFAANGEIARVRGADSVPALATILSVERARVAVNFAPAPVLASLPGFTPELVARLMERRARGEQLQHLADLTDGLSRVATESVLAHFNALGSRATVEPDAWLLIVTAPARPAALAFTVELRLEFAGYRLAVVRRREW